MFEITLVFCLLSSPTTCHEERPLEEYGTQLACFLEGQVLASQWLDDHPTWRLDHWTCEPPSSRQEKI